MLKRTLTFIPISVLAVLLPVTAVARPTTVGRLTNVTETTISVNARETITFTLDHRTKYTKWITQKPLQEETRLNPRALAVGRLVAVHPQDDDGTVVAWVQIATDMRPDTRVAALFFGSFPLRPAPSAVQTFKSSDVLTSQQVRDLIATATTPADHVKLQKHFLALASKYEADAAEHAANAQAYRKNPSFLESKNPIGPRTAAHCERFAELARRAAKEARDLASAHEHMAAAK